MTGMPGVRRPATTVLPVDVVRRLEADAMAELPPGTLMARAAAAIAVQAGGMLREVVGRVTGSRVVLLVGSGDNGGDALLAGAHLARRGAKVDALLVSDRHHEATAAALVRAGGLLHQVELGDLEAAELVARADLVVDGILGIGGRGALREPAATLALVARETDVAVLAVDLPSGVDAGTGEVADPDAVVHADRTVTMGALKPGLLQGDGAVCAGEIAVVDIGLDLDDADDTEAVLRVDDDEAAEAFDRPGPDDDKYTRGVVGVSAGSARYPGAAVLATAGARHGAAGYVRYSGGAAAQVVAAHPDVVATEDGPAAAGRVQCWVVGPGRGTDDEARAAVAAALALDVPVVLDADALTLLSDDEALRAAVRDREAATVLTPHAGELARLTGGPVGADRLAVARAVAADLDAVVLLKGASTVVSAPSGVAFLVVSGPPELATAGSGDVLSGLIGSLLAHHEAVAPVDDDLAAALAAAAAHVHGVAGALAATGGRTVTSADVAAHVPAAVARVRRAPVGSA